MYDHPTIKLCIFVDNLWYRTRHAPIVTRNVLAIADTGAQTNSWSLRNFLAAGFNPLRTITFPGINFFQTGGFCVVSIAFDKVLAKFIKKYFQK